MTIEETGAIMNILKVAYPRFYNGADVQETTNALKLWYEMFADDDVSLVAVAVKSYIATDEKGFPPHIGAIKNSMYNLLNAKSIDSVKAWDLVRKAVSKSAYGAQEEFENLPESIRSIVGSPRQLFEWSQMESDVFNSVVASNFQRSYRARQESEKRFSLFPEDVKKEIYGITKRIELESGEQNGL